MYLTYLDESGSPGDLNTPFFVLTGVSVFERQTHWLERELDAIAEPFERRAGRELKLHAAPMKAGKEGWELFSSSERAQAAADVVRVLVNTRPKLNVFAAVVEQSQMLHTVDILPYCYEVLASKFDDYLALKYQRERDPQRGLFVLDQKRATEEKAMQSLHHTFKHVGHATGKLRNFAEVPMFVDSTSTRLIQLADSIAYWIFRHYARLDNWAWPTIQPCFASLGNGRTGLHQVLDPATPGRLATAAPPRYPMPPAIPGSAGQALVPAPSLAAPAARLSPGALVIP
ncbi:DUF3800 domain-containing protein [Pandoraea oxalativorans]|uniref:DUF3800 domain-containing protein n=1 Tax=Pandoraea oxalativorans TaxID=573737 RepID=A0A0G3IGU7_9BURK|nr:DUF3800 domain-containing protein [Pandoraea oxalativorans]AKK25086.1 hypothetical protein MB84_30495 [Pandoraea oxalativorans]